MIINIHLSATSFVPLSVSVGEGDEVKVKVTSDFDIKKTGRLIVRGEKEKTFRLDREIDITDFCETPGKVCFEAVNTVDGDIVRRWAIETLIVKKINGEFAEIPQITALEKKIEVLTKAILEIEKLVKGE